ncbi:MAG TPA: four-helix bundle copper-binding protein [Gammaproteobacteria bacterium]
MERQREAGNAGIGGNMRAAVEVANRCRDVCLGTAVNYCLREGGEHAEQAHLRLMLDCAEICRTAGTFMLVDSPYHQDVCAVCAEICDDCARECEDMEGMEACAQACRDCAESCRQMADAEPHLQTAGAVARARRRGSEAHDV